MNICVIADGYPSKKHIEFTFVKELCEAWAKMGHKISVIAPQSITKALIRRKFILPQYTRDSINKNQGLIEIYRPLYFSLGNIGEKYLSLSKLKDNVINRTFKKLKSKPDVIYGHFWHSGYSGFKYAHINRIPLFVATGESEIKFSIHSMNNQRFVDNVKGVICVSSKNKNESIKRGLTNGENCIVIPNAIDKSIFFQYPKETVRDELRIGEKDFVVVFVGWFIPRKGPDRVAKALTMANDPAIKAIFIGSGKDGVNISPDYSENLFVGEVDHKLLPKYLSAADVFVLPTLQEGCCNAIIEAMSCGLPIVSSDLEFNYDILDDKNSILIDPLDERQICEAIVSLKNNRQKLSEMGNESLKKVQENTIENRAKNIIEFIHKRLSKQEIPDSNKLGI